MRQTKKVVFTGDSWWSVLSEHRYVSLATGIVVFAVYERAPGECHSKIEVSSVEDFPDAETEK